jgi:uncharacterized protein (DUF983 family)
MTGPVPPARSAWRYLARALRLRCPVCGAWPLFRPVRQWRSPLDWFETLPGCPHCQYAYDREPGYFMLALWTFDYGAAALFGLGLFGLLFNFFDLSTRQLLFFTLGPTFVVAILMVRPAKALYLALDHYFFHADG